MTENQQFTLWYRKGEDTLQELVISAEVLIGSDPDCNLVIQGEHIAPRHARLTVKDEQVFITDLDSESGTLLDGERLSPQRPGEFNPGQTLSIGEYTFSLFQESKVQTAVSGENAPVPEPSASPPSEILASSSETPVKRIFGARLDWFSNNARWLGIAIWIGVLIIGIATYFIITARLKAGAALVDTPTPLQTLEQPTTPTQTPEFISPSLPTALTVSTLVSVMAPGEGEILIEPITLLAENINLNNLFSNGLNIGQLLELTTNIAGDKIGYAYRYVALSYNQHIITIQKTFISAETTREIDGVPYPDWGSGNIPVKFEWKPSVYFINDGNKSEIALVYPTDYGVKEEDTHFAVDGWYIFSQGGEKRKARVFFDPQGKMLYILGYKQNEQGIDAPYDIKPQAGDQFTILLEEFRFEESGTAQGTQTAPNVTNLPFGGTISGLVGDQIPYAYGKGSFVQFEGGTLTFGDQGLFWTTDENYAGGFYVGFAAEDLDGNYYAGYVPVLVKLK